MLTREHSIVVYEGRRALPDRLTQATHRHYRALAELMLDLYRQGVGKTRRDLHRAVEGLFEHEVECDPRRIRAFCKLLDDAATYDTDREKRASSLRQTVFALATEHHPLVSTPETLFDHDEAKAKRAISGRLGRPWSEIDAALYADLPAFHRLRSFEGFPHSAALLARYNVAQLQACLYDAEHVTIEAGADFKTLLRYAKLARLLHDITPLPGDRYFLELTGPASVLRETRVYGASFARFLPAVLACRDWRLQARVRTPWRTTATLELSSADRFHSHLPRLSEFDSTVEEKFAKKFGEERAGWRLSREAAILCLHQKAFVPDFVLRHADGREVLLEIVGFWTPEYLEAKLATLATFADRAIVVAIAERSLPQAWKVELPPNVVPYKTVVKVDAVLAKAEMLGGSI
jgi:predicted nuclease of restriction endonuclease-like RecB superfamily